MRIDITIDGVGWSIWSVVVLGFEVIDEDIEEVVGSLDTGFQPEPVDSIDVFLTIQQSRDFAEVVDDLLNLLAVLGGGHCGRYGMIMRFEGWGGQSWWSSIDAVFFDIVGNSPRFPEGISDGLLLVFAQFRAIFAEMDEGIEDGFVHRGHVEGFDVFGSHGGLVIGDYGMRGGVVNLSRRFRYRRDRR